MLHLHSLQRRVSFSGTALPHEPHLTLGLVTSLWGIDAALRMSMTETSGRELRSLASWIAVLSLRRCSAVGGPILRSGCARQYAQRASDGGKCARQ